MALSSARDCWPVLPGVPPGSAKPGHAVGEGSEGYVLNYSGRQVWGEGVKTGCRGKAGGGRGMNGGCGVEGGHLVGEPGLLHRSASSAR